MVDYMASITTSNRDLKYINAIIVWISTSRFQMLAHLETADIKIYRAVSTPRANRMERQLQPGHKDPEKWRLLINLARL